MSVDHTRALFDAIRSSGFYPGVASAEVRRLVGGDAVRGHLVLTEVRVDSEDGLQMEAQVLAVTDSRLVFWGGYEEPGQGGQPPVLHSHARVFPMSRISDVRVLSSVTNPAEFEDGDVPDSVRVVFVMDAMDRVEFEEIVCGDEDCGGGHGWNGDVIHDALVFAETRDAVGEAKLVELLEVGAVVSRLLGSRP